MKIKSGERNEMKKIKEREEVKERNKNRVGKKEK